MSTAEVVFDQEPWFDARPEPIVQLVGSLETRSEPIGPGTRGGHAFTFRSTEIELPVYAAGVEMRLRPLVGKRIAVQGRIVQVGATAELWIGHLTTQIGRADERGTAIG